jgi:cytochrome c553
MQEDPAMRSTRLPVSALLTLLSLSMAAAAPAGEAGDPPLASQPDSARGRQLYVGCAGCHGSDAGGKPDGSVPAIAGQHWQVLTKLLLDFRYFRRWDSRMVNASASDHLRSPQDIADVVAYVSRLPAQRPSGIGGGEHVAAGARAYAAQCAACHGQQAQGDGPAGYPRLAGQQYGYLLRQIRNGREGSRPTFSQQHVRTLRDLAEADIDAIADYLSRIELAPAI